MPQSLTYAQLLRPIGQALEALGAESFRLQVDRDDFVIRGKTAPKPAPAAESSRPKSLRVVWELLRGGKPKGNQPPAGPSAGAFEVTYTPEDIAFLDVEGQSRRRNPELTPEAHSLSQILRAVGAFVDEKKGRLVAIQKQDQAISIEYESALNRMTTQEFTVSTLYDYWVRMYLKRSGRATARNR
ncbi:MAG TPA: hypothetical protein VNN77_07780 [candidate division Zixibacteria bacterium]|nr:hypothetical protein [candidate division Zixibacteria bacterium]